MAKQDDQRKRHFILEGMAETERFHSPQQGGGGASVPERNRSQHGGALMRQLEALRPHLVNAREAQEAAGIEEGFGLQVEFESFPDIELAFESLSRERSGIELSNVRHDEQRTFATVFVPDGKLEIFENLIHAYLDDSKDTKRGPKNHKLLNTISEIRAATLNTLWTDDPAVLPATDEETFWWEVWLPVRGDQAAVTGRFKQLAEGLGFQLAPWRAPVSGTHRVARVWVGGQNEAIRSNVEQHCGVAACKRNGRVFRCAAARGATCMA